MAKLITLLGLVLLIAVPAAATNIVFDYLLRTPMTLIDAGVMRIEAVLSKLNTDGHQRPKVLGGILGQALIEKDYLLINVNASQPANVKPAPSCQDLLLFVEDRLGFCSRNDYYSQEPAQQSECEGPLRNQFVSGALDNFFSNHGYEVNGRPEKLGALLSEYLVIQAGIIPESGAKKEFCHRVASGPIQEGLWFDPFSELNKFKNSEEK